MKNETGPQSGSSMEVLAIFSYLLTGDYMRPKDGLIPNAAKPLLQHIFVFRRQSHKMSHRIWGASVYGATQKSRTLN
jgi:hypothetical protein